MKKEHGDVGSRLATPITSGIYTDAATISATSLLDISNDLIAAVDPNLRFVAINGPFLREFELVFGKTLRSGDSIIEVLGHLTNDRDKAAALCRRALSGEAFRVIEDFGDNRLLRKSYELAFTPIFDTHHQAIFAAIVVRDLSMARVTERRFGPLLEVAPDATIIMRSNGRVDFANMQAEKMFGYERYQMHGVCVEDLIPQRFRTKHVAQRNEFASSPATRPMGSGKTTLLGLRADGNEFPVEISLNPLNVDGEQFVVAAIRDMTARQRNEDELRAQSVELERRVAERTAELEQTTKAFRATFEQASVGVAHVDLQGNWIRVNNKLCEIVGYPKEELATMSFQDITHPEDLNADLKLMYQLIDGAIPFYTLDKRYIHKGGSIVWISLNVSLVHDSVGTPEYFISIVKDINARKQAEAGLQRSKESLELAIAATGLGMFDYVPNTDPDTWSAEIMRQFVLKSDVNVNCADSLVQVHPDDCSRVETLVKQSLNPMSGGQFHTEYRVTGCDQNTERWIEARGKTFFDSNGTPTRFIGTTLDISEHKQAEERIRHTALHDPLTDLPNRGLLFEFARHVFSHARRARRHSAILFIDLDRFKPINDNHGHEVGDEVLKDVAKRLVLCTREEDQVFRLGGDEFLVLLPDIENDANAGDVARHIAESLNKPYIVNGLELYLSSSIGIGIFPRDGNDIDTLINNADAAMYQAKQAGRNDIQFYSQELAVRSQLQRQIEGRLTKALAQNAFELFYQPVVDMKTAEVLGVEALVRWPHKEIGPDLFVPIAESTGQIARISEWVIAEACRQHKAWRKQGMPSIPIAVNISTVQLRDKNFAAEFAEVLHNCVLDFSALQIEVTETALMENLEGAIDALYHLKTLGITIALDDFGTGYSSLNYLSRLPLDKIKVDKSFIQRIEHDASSRAITEAVIALGRTLNLEVVAEGIESEETMIYLRQHGCSQAQGYHVCRPLSAAGFEAWLGTYTAGFRTLSADVQRTGRGI